MKLRRRHKHELDPDVELDQDVTVKFIDHLKL